MRIAGEGGKTLFFTKKGSAWLKTRSAVLRIVLRSVTYEQYAPLALDSRALRLIVFSHAENPPSPPAPPSPLFLKKSGITLCVAAQRTAPLMGFACERSRPGGAEAPRRLGGSARSAGSPNTSESFSICWVNLGLRPRTTQPTRGFAINSLNFILLVERRSKIERSAHDSSIQASKRSFFERLGLNHL